MTFDRFGFRMVSGQMDLFWFFLWITDQSKTFRLSDGSFNRFGFQTVSDNWILTGFALDTGSK